MTWHFHVKYGVFVVFEDEESAQTYAEHNPFVYITCWDGYMNAVCVQEGLSE